MDIFDFALKMESDGETYYRALAEKVIYEDLKTVLVGLADDEHRHFEIIKSVQNQTFNYGDDPKLSKIKNVFAADNKDLAPENKELMAKLKDEQIDVYRAALLREKESVALYKKLIIASDLQEQKAICETLMHEEEKHMEVIDNIIDMLNHVNDWVEAAEFNHHNKY